MKRNIDGSHSLKAENKPKNWRAVLVQPRKPSMLQARLKGHYQPAQSSSFCQQEMTIENLKSLRSAVCVCVWTMLVKGHNRNAEHETLSK